MHFYKSANVQLNIEDMCNIVQWKQVKGATSGQEQFDYIKRLLFIVLSILNVAWWVTLLAYNGFFVRSFQFWNKLLRPACPDAFGFKETVFERQCSFISFVTFFSKLDF